MSVRIRGLDDVKATLMDIGPREATNLVRVVVFDLTKQIRNLYRSIV